MAVDGAGVGRDMLVVTVGGRGGCQSLLDDSGGPSGGLCYVMTEGYTAFFFVTRCQSSLCENIHRFKVDAEDSALRRRALTVYVCYSSG